MVSGTACDARSTAAREDGGGVGGRGTAAGAAYPGGA